MLANQDLQELSRALRAELPRLARQYGVTSLALFGSYVRHEQRPDSDLDVLVTFNQVPSLLRLIELENQLSDLLHVKVDLVLRDSLKPAIGQRILSEALPV
jgi:predicted nucleotidyltransferase